MAKGLWRKMWLVLVAVLAVVGAYCLWEGYSMRRKWREMAKAVPADFVVDLADVGHHSAPVSHTHCSVHGLDVQLQVDPPFSSQEEIAQALEGLRATLAIGDPGAELDQPMALSPDSFSEFPWSHSGLREEERGVYFHYTRELGPPRETRAMLTVDQPATGTKGRGQRLVMRYALCGVETDLGPAVAGIIGGLLVLPALVTGIVLACSRVRRSRRTQSEVGATH